MLKHWGLLALATIGLAQAGASRADNVIVTADHMVDVLAGKVKRAPRWVQRIGCEWVYRLVQEPRRMWKRYLVGNTAFMWLTVKELWRTR